MWSKGETPTLMVGNQTYTDTMEIILPVTQKRGICVSRYNYTTLGHEHKGRSTILFLCGILNDSQKQENI